MCYNVESSLKTTLLSLASIIYLFSSGDPHYKWVALTLVGWCLMQFAELILWTTEPRTECTNLNKVITLSLIPIVLMLQPIGSLLGSLFVTSWGKSSDFRKFFLVSYSAFIVLLVGVNHYYKPYKICTTVTSGGHLYWSTSNDTLPDTTFNKIIYFLWGALIFLPLALYWDKKFTIILSLVLLPMFGFFHGLLNTDSRASIWCYYTSYTSVIASAFLLLKQTVVYNVL